MIVPAAGPVVFLLGLAAFRSLRGLSGLNRELLNLYGGCLSALRRVLGSLRTGVLFAGVGAVTATLRGLRPDGLFPDGNHNGGSLGRSRFGTLVTAAVPAVPPGLFGSGFLFLSGSGLLRNRRDHHGRDRPLIRFFDFGLFRFRFHVLKDMRRFRAVLRTAARDGCQLVALYS